MSVQQRGLDVLAVMDVDRKVMECANKVAPCPEFLANHDEARAAVADLIERERMAREALEGFRDSGPSGGQNFREWHQSYDDAVEKARAYFARVKCGAA